MSKQKPPKPSQQELQLLESQKSMLDLQREQLARQQEQQQQLAPLLYETMGIKPQYNDQGQITGYQRFETPEQGLYREQVEAMRRQQPVQEQLQQQYLTLAQQQADYQRQQGEWQAELAPQMKEQALQQTALQGQLVEYQQAQLAQEQDRQRLQPLLYEASGVRPIYDESGKITSFALTEEAQARKDYEQQLLEHQRKALAGELPVDPTLERSLAEGEQQLRAQLQAQLGTGYETSTPGIQALEQYRQRAAEARANVAHGQLTSGQQLLQTQAGMNAEQMARSTRGGTGLIGQYGFQPVSFGGQVNAPGQSLFQAGSPAAAAAGYQGALSGQFGTLGEYAKLAQGFGSAAGSLGQITARQQQQYDQMQAAYAGQMGQIGTIAGSVLGGVVGSVVPGLGTAAGAGAGATLGGAAGAYYGRSTY